MQHHVPRPIIKQKIIVPLHITHTHTHRCTTSLLLENRRQHHKDDQAKPSLIFHAHSSRCHHHHHDIIAQPYRDFNCAGWVIAHSSTINPPQASFT
jgi:hypothetical protein